jgi:hypothetical protein
MTLRIEVCSCILNEWDIHKIEIHKYTVSIHYFDSITGEYKVHIYRNEVKK